MPKTWEQMTQAEKIEDLRRDVVTLFDAYNDMNRRLMAGGLVVGQRLEQVQKTLNEVGEKLAALEDRLNSGEIVEDTAREIAQELERSARSLPPSF
jgi:polyhydroxyalkanoate synthesis regulator phasin